MLAERHGRHATSVKLVELSKVKAECVSLASSVPKGIFRVNLSEEKTRFLSVLKKCYHIFISTEIEIVGFSVVN